jgi:hypothetical protein
MDKPVPNVNEQVWKDDVTELEELALDCWKVTYNFFQRLTYQGAHPDLVLAMSEISMNFANAQRKLKEIEPLFPPEEGEREQQ